MAPGRNEDLSATPRGAPSLAGPTQTSEPLPHTPSNPTTGHESHPPPLPTQVRDHERYQFLGEHGRGGLGRVSRAHDRELGRDVAIKELLSRGNAHEVRFLREVLLTARLEHPGIVPIHEAGRWADGTPFYAMKLVAGRPLRELIAERSRVEDRIGLLHHVIAVADAIAYAHGRHIIHRDLKPANVIVGDFGETIVIDWGLAKDLTSAEVSASGDGPFRTSASDELTSTGSVMGTPAYMAPEQKLGEQVDQRADVYAIGVMLWELCSLAKLPPTRVHLRHRILRRAGIDEDLAAIIDKAIDPDPDRRYRDAGALAADLKAFKSGARIAARRYSLFAMLAHWTRRHRALALTVTAVVSLAATGSLMYVRNIAVERDRADTSEEIAKRARAGAEASLDELTLKHAELLLTTDPSAAIDVLATYRGADRQHADQIRAEALGRGVAFVRAVPHTGNVIWAQGVAGGAILSLGSDGTISRTSLDGASVVLVRDASKSGISSYAPARHLLAYACNPSAVCLFDVLHTESIPVAPALRDAHVAGASFSPDGTLLALLSQDAVLNVFDVTDPARPTLRLSRPSAGGVDVEFIGDDAMTVGLRSGIEFVHIQGDAEAYPFPDTSRWAVSTTEHALALATAQGQALVLDSFPVRVTARAELCHGPLAGLQFVPRRRSIAYACKDGAIGLWDLQQGTVGLKVRLEGHADLIFASAAGDYLLAAGGNGTVTVLDLVTDLITTYKGHGFRLTSLTPPTPEHPFLISGDVRGGLRVWPLPARLARVAATSSSPFHTAVFDAQSVTVMATTWLPALTTFSPATGVRTIEPHLRDNLFLERSRDGRTFATYGLHDTVEVWSAATMTRTRVIATGHGSVSQLSFVDATDDFLTAGHDGKLVRWTPSGEPATVAHVDLPIDRFAMARASGALVFSTVDGALWRTGADGKAVSLRGPGARVNRLVAAADRQTVYAGYASGDVIAIDATSWRQETVLRGPGAVQEIAITGDGRTLAVATNDGVIHLGVRRDGGPPPAAVAWVSLAGRARHITMAPDGLLVASYTDGTIWLYSTSRRRWLCLPTGTVDLGRTAVTDNGSAAAVLDFEGHLLWIDLDAARKRLDAPTTTPGE